MTASFDYVPPKVWSWNKPNGGRFANINRPIAGPTHDKDLPVGHHPLQLYSQGTPNGVKVTVMLEELLALGNDGAEYDAWLIRIGQRDQFGSGFVALNPNSKIPALVDQSDPMPVRVFESGAILIYLAEKFGVFLSTGRCARRMPVVAVLAGGKRALRRWGLRPLLRLRADQDRICHRSVRHGGKASTRRARPAARSERIHRWQRLHDRRYRRLALVRRSDKGLALSSCRVPAGTRVPEREALGRRDRRAASRPARANGQPRHWRTLQSAARAP
jgi:glutathione S-transferase